MTTSQGMPPQVAVAINDLMDNCAEVEAGQQVLILAATDGLHGGWNLVDEQTIAWVQAATQLRGAYPNVLWLDIPVRRAVLWPDIPTRDNVWRVPPVLKAAVKGADVIINHVLDLSSEEELKEWPEVLAESGLGMCRNMATTAPLLASAWARTPHELVCEIRKQAAEVLQPGARSIFTHPNGTHLEADIGPPGRGSGYAVARARRGGPFPEGIFQAINPVNAEGILVFDRMMPVWAWHIGVPPAFREPVRITVEKNHMVKFEGGAEADALRGFFASLARIVGEEDAYEVRGPHGGIHPAARVSPRQCPDEDYREFIASFHTSSIHMHLGQGRRSHDFPFSLHPSPELRGASWQIGDRLLYDQGRLTVMDHPEVLAVAARYPDRPGLDAERWH